MIWPFNKPKEEKGLKINNGPDVVVEHPFMRAGTILPSQEINFVYNHGGVGDYIHWTTALQWIFETHKHLHGSVIAPKYFHELARHWLKPYEDRVIVRSYTKIEDDKFLSRTDQLFLMPNVHQMINSCGFHLLNIGFHFFANLDEVPEGWRKIPEIKGDEANISWINLPKKYAVVTTEATSPIRKLKAETINGITDYLKSNGVTPVFLGKKELHHDYKAASAEGINLEGVLDLREKTSLLEAACILANAWFVAGLDNGLLHLACCSKVPVVFGFNTVDPRHRAPPRIEGSKTIAVVPSEKLECRFCQSRVRFVLGHNFHNCLYGDNKCLDHLSVDMFIAAIEKVTGQGLT